jgi:hypothetical protein
MNTTYSDTPTIMITDEIQKNNDKNINPNESSEITSKTNVIKSTLQEFMPDNSGDDLQIRNKYVKLQNRIYNYYNGNINDNQNHINNINDDLLNKTKLININNKSYSKKQETSTILFSTIFFLILLGIIGFIGNLIGMKSKTLYIIYTLIIFVYLLYILWIVKFSKPQWDPYLIKKIEEKNDDIDSQQNGDSSNISQKCINYGCILKE